MQQPGPAQVPLQLSSTRQWVVSSSLRVDSAMDRSMLNHAPLCLSWRPAAASSAAQLYMGAERRADAATSIPNLPPGQPPQSSPSFLPRYTAVQDSMLFCPAWFSSPFRQLLPEQSQCLLGQSQPRKQGFSSSLHPHTASLGVPGSGATSPQAPLRAQPALCAAHSVNSVCQASGQGQEGLGSRHLPHGSAGWARVERQRLVSRLQ